MKKRLLVLSILALTSLNLYANCGYGNGCGPIPCDTPCCYPSSWYVATRGAVTWRRDVNFNTTSGVNLSTDFKEGGSASFALGYNFQCICMRLELEALYQRNSMKSVTFSNFPTGSAEFNTTMSTNGAVQDFALMANLYYDFNFCSCLKFYVGGGIGIDWNRIRLSTLTLPNQLGVSSLQDFNLIVGNPFPGIKSSKHSTYFAWNAMAGLTYTLTPCWYLDLGYRLFSTTKLKFNGDSGFSKSNIPLVHRAEAGLRYNF